MTGGTTVTNNTPPTESKYDFLGELRKQSLIRIAQEELTPIQMDILTECILKGRSQVDVAKERGVNRSTVSRILKRATKKVQKFAKYL